MKEELALAARRFVCVLDGLDFKGLTNQHKDIDNGKNAAKPTYEVRRGPSPILNADSEEEATEVANKLNNLVNTFVLEEFERLKKKFEEYNS